MTPAATPSSPSTQPAQTATPLTNPQLDGIRQRLRRLGLYGLLERIDEIAGERWLLQVLEIEENARLARSFKRRLDNARLGSFKPMADFDYDWPKVLDRMLLDELFTLSFLDDAANVVVVGPHGLGKTMIIKNLVHQSVLRGYTARFTAASDMLHDLASQDSSTLLSRRLRRYITPSVLGIDEVGYLAYDTRYADLLFEVVTRRYQLRRPIIVTTNKIFQEWNQVFPNATSVVALIDRLVHRSEILKIDGESYRLKEAEERAATRTGARAAGKKARKAVNGSSAK
jgi:DNA replication protein DnaC